MLNLIDTTVENNAPKSKIDPRVQERLRVWLDDHIAASKRKPNAEVVTLVPALAALLLERNPVNRPISKSNASELRQDVASDRFMFNGESIVVSDTGVLLDGQHRCKIVVDTGIPIETVIAFGPKEAARFTIDTGKVKKPDEPLNDIETKDKQVQALMAAWNRAGKEAREDFLALIEQPVMDRRFK